MAPTPPHPGVADGSRIIARGAAALPFAIARLREGAFVLNQAMKDITGFDLPSRSPIESEQARARRWVLWWEGTQARMADGALAEWLAENHPRIEGAVVPAVRRLAGVPELLARARATDLKLTESEILRVAAKNPELLGSYVAEEFDRAFAHVLPTLRASLRTLAREIAKNELWSELQSCVAVLVREAA